MTAPTCPTHGSPMRAGQKGGWFCPRKMDDGTYCTQRVSTPKPTATETRPMAAAASGGSSPRLLLLLGCLDFASRVFQGTAQAEDARELAASTFADMIERAKS